MTISPIDESQRKAARVAGFAYLITFATVVCVNFGIHDRLIVGNNAAETSYGSNWVCMSFGTLVLPDRGKMSLGKRCCSSWS